jgi:hypothetical protein
MTNRRIVQPDELIRTPNKVTEAYCMLQGFVNEKVFGFSLASDCFCPVNRDKDDTFWRSDPDVYEFIVAAVEEKIARRQTFKFETKTYVVAVDEEQAQRQYENLINSDQVPYTIEEVEE